MRARLAVATWAAVLLGGQLAAQAPVPPADLLTDLSDDGSLVAGLASADAGVRRVAARGLSRLHEPAQASEALLQRAASETDAAVRCEIAFALGARRYAPAAGWLAGLLALDGHADPAVRAAACDAIGRLGDDAAATPLVLRLSDNDAGVRGAAALALFALDGRRFPHERRAPEPLLVRRDSELTTVALNDPDPGARWRAVYTLAGVRGRRGFATALQLALRDDEPLSRVFALRGLAALHREGLGTPFDPLPFFADPDERVIVEAARAATVLGAPADVAPALAALLATHPNGLVRASAAESLGPLLWSLVLDPDTRRRLSDALADAGRHDASPMVRRAAAAALVKHGDEGRALWFLHALARGADRRDRERAATVLKEGSLLECDTLLALLADDDPTVAGAALGTLLAKDPQDVPLYDLPRATVVDYLVAALGDADPALLVAAAESILPEAQAGTADPRLLQACAVSLLSATGPEMKEAAQMQRRALGLPPDSAAPAAPPAGRLLDRLLAQDEAARADPHPRVRLVTTRGEVLLELDRVTAPVHVASFLELVDRGCYDGLDFHRVAPNFVVQGLDPRGDGFGTGGRRLPDEFSREPYLAGSLGMPNAGEANTGGCQVFLTHVPTPHLDGHYTLFGRVVEGLDAVQRLEIGDGVARARRGDGPAP